MKKTGIINGELIYHIAMLGHKDLFMIGDAGMPIPEGVTVIDLAVCKGVPTFEQVFNAIMDDTAVEKYYLADEIVDKNERLLSVIQDRLEGVECEMMPHDELKKFSAKCKFAIRTGEFSPYPNVILQAGVVF